MSGNYKDNTTQRCLPCTSSSGKILRQCSEFANTVCDSASGCSAGQGPIPDQSATGCCATCEVGVTHGGPFPDGTGTGYTCMDVSTCLPGTENTTEPTGTSDRQCSSCTAFDNYTAIAAATYQPNDGSIPGVVTTCLPVSRCPPGEGASSAPTLIADTICEACPTDASGQWFSLDGGPCQPPTACPPGQEQRTASTASTDRVSWPTCSPGFYARTTATGLVCQRCARGTFSSVNDRDSCLRKSHYCQAGDEIAEGSVGDATRGTVCTPCVQGVTFSTGAVGGQCEPVTLCGPDTQESAPPTTITDRVCAAVKSEASSAENDAGSDSIMLIIVIVIAALIVVAFVIIALVVVKKAQNGPANDFDRNIAFETPLYDQAETSNPTFGEDNTYSEPVMAGGAAYVDFQGGQEEEEEEGTGYMDVPAGQNNADGGISGYMDVSPQVQADFGDDTSDEEEEDI